MERAGEKIGEFVNHTILLGFILDCSLQELVNQVVKHVQTHQYIGEFERVFLSSPISVGEFYLIFSYAVMLILERIFEISSFWSNWRELSSSWRELEGKLVS